MRLKILSIVIAASLPGIAYSTDKTAKTKIQVVDNSSDTVGHRLIYQLKERIRASHSMELAPQGDFGCIRIIVLTVDKESDNANLKGYATVFAVIWLAVLDSEPAVPRFLDSSIGYSGGQRIAETADDIIAKTDRLLGSMGAPSG